MVKKKKKNSQTFTDSVHLKTPLKHNSFSTTHSYTTLWMTSKPHKYPGPRLVITQKEIVKIVEIVKSPL